MNWELLVAKEVIRIRVAGVGLGGGGGHRGVYECMTVPSRLVGSDLASNPGVEYIPSRNA